jgi:hypothetical protein
MQKVIGKNGNKECFILKTIQIVYKALRRANKPNLTYLY